MNSVNTTHTFVIPVSVFQIHNLIGWQNIFKDTVHIISWLHFLLLYASFPVLALFLSISVSKMPKTWAYSFQTYRNVANKQLIGVLSIFKTGLIMIHSIAVCPFMLKYTYKGDLFSARPCVCPSRLRYESNTGFLLVKTRRGQTSRLERPSSDVCFTASVNVQKDDAHPIVPSHLLKCVRERGCYSMWDS